MYLAKTFFTNSNFVQILFQIHTLFKLFKYKKLKFELITHSNIRGLSSQGAPVFFGCQIHSG